jgi:hypothetical protein
MKNPFPILLAAFFALTVAGIAADDPQTLLTRRGKLLASEDFSKPLAPLTGKPVGFASGFQGWRYNGSPKSGHWELVDGAFNGAEIAESHHPATASYGIQFRDAIIQCDVRLNDVPAAGRTYRSIFVKATDTKDYVCAFNVGPGGINLVPYDNTRINPTTKQREKGEVTRTAVPVKLGEWYTVVLEIKGDEVVGTLNGKSITLCDPLFAADKHSVMLGVGTEASFRNFRIWEALPNPDWPKHKESLATAAKPASK